MIMTFHPEWIVPGVSDREFAVGILQFEVVVSDFWLRANVLKWMVKIFLV